MPEACQICPQMIGQSPQKHHDVCSVIDSSLRRHVATLYQHRDATGIYPGTDYNTLPQNQSGFIWRIRQFDVNWVLSQLGTNQHILEIGAWNGWLSHHVARDRHQLTSIEYSDHPTDGLGAKQFYNVGWHTIQMDLTQLELFRTLFDVVIINHGLHYFPHPIDYVKKAQTLVNKGGHLLLLNAMFYRDPRKRIEQIQSQSEEFQRAYGYSYFIKPSRGYMNFDDRSALTAAGVKLRPYPVMRRANLKARFRGTAPSYWYGVWNH